MYGGAKYSAADLVAYTRPANEKTGEPEKHYPAGGLRLRNGALAGYVKVKGKYLWRIVEGANDEHMARIQRKRGEKVVHRKISPKMAQLAFDRHYHEDRWAKSGYKSLRGLKQARTYDLNHTKNVVDDARYRRSPHRYDYQGIDTGSKTRAPRSQDQLANDQLLKTVERQVVPGVNKNRKTLPKGYNPSPKTAINTAARRAAAEQRKAEKAAKRQEGGRYYW